MAVTTSSQRAQGSPRHRLRPDAPRTLPRLPRRGHRQRHRLRASADVRNIRLLWAGQFINTAGLMMLVPIMPFYVERMGVHGTVEVQSWAGAAIAAPAFALVFATPLWGRLGDRVGRKWMVVRALVGLAAAMVVMAAAVTPVALVAGRLLQGILGGVVEAAAGFASTSGAAGKRGATLGKSFGATAAGALIGPILGGVFVGRGNLSVLMLVIAALALVLAVASAGGLTEPPRPAPAQTTKTQRSASSGRPRRRLAVAGPLALAAAAAYFGVYGLIPVFAQYTQSLVTTPSSAGLWVGVAQSLTWGATLLASPWWGRRNDRCGRPLASFALAAAGCGVAIAAQALPIALVAVLGLRIVQGACFAALAQSLFFHASATARADKASGAVGSANSFLLIGQSAGPLMAGPLVSALPIPAVVALLGGTCLLAALLAARTARRDTPPVRIGRSATLEGAQRQPAPCEARWNTPLDAPTSPLYRIGAFHQAPHPSRPIPTLNHRSPVGAGRGR